MGYSLLYTGDLVLARTHCDKAIELYDRGEHRPLATRFGQDSEVAILAYRSRILGSLAIPRWRKPMLTTR